MTTGIKNFMVNWISRYPRLFSVLFFVSGISMSSMFSLGGFAKPIYIPFLIILYIITYIFLIKKNIHKKAVANTSNLYLWIALAITIIISIKYNEIIFIFLQDFLCLTRYSQIVFQYEIFQYIYKYLNIVVFVLCLLSFFSIWIFTTLLLKKFLPSTIRFIKTFDKVDKWALFIALVISTPTVFLIYANTNAFYEPCIENTYPSYNIFYSMDTPSHFSENVWLNMGAQQNDFKQPLFALMSLPSSVPAVALSYIFPILGTRASYAAWLCITQFLMSIVSFLLLAKMMRLSSIDKILFLILMCSTYTIMIFSINLEQYIVTLFWLIVFIYLTLEKSKNSFFAAIGTVGSMVSNIAILPLLLKNKEYRNFKKWFQLAFVFIITIIICGKTVAIINAPLYLKQQVEYTGLEVTFADKFHQYSDFILSCFIAPSHEVMTVTEVPVIKSISKPEPNKDIKQHLYSQTTTTSINWWGVGLFIFCIVYGVINRKKSFVQVATYWIFFSFLLLCIIGWGTKDNIQFLYTPCFSWAFVSLVFIAIVRSLDKIPIIKYTILSTLIIFVFTYNSLIFKDILEFGITYYPR